MDRISDTEVKVDNVYTITNSLVGITKVFIILGESQRV